VDFPRGSVLRALVFMFLLELATAGLWFLFAIVTVPLSLMAFGLVMLVLRACAILVMGRMFRGLIYVRDFWSALGAAFVVTVAAHLINLYAVPFLLDVLK